MIAMSKFVRPAAFAAALLLLGTAAFAQDAPKPTTGDKPAKQERFERQGGKFGHGARRGFRGMRGERGMGRMLMGIHRLDLTDAQKDQIKTLMKTHWEGNQPLRDEMHTLMQKRRDGTFTDADKARVEEIHTSMKTSGDQLRTTVLGLLTPEQTQKLEQMKAEREQRMQERKQRFLERKERMKERMKDQETPAPPVVKQP